MLNSRILIVDDIHDNIKMLTQILSLLGYSAIEGTTQPAQVQSLVQKFEPDLIILDLMMAGIDGYKILDNLREIIPEEEFLPILVVTADHTERARERALALGATDFITRPHQVFDLTLRVRNLLRSRDMHLKWTERNRDLETQVRQRTLHLEELAFNLKQSTCRLQEFNEKLEEAQIELKLAKQDVIERLALVGEHHDDDTGLHTQRVAHTSFLIAQQLGLSFEEAYNLQLATPLHDVGKIGVPDSILLKPGRLTPEEFDRMKTHCEIGHQLLAGGRSELLHTAQQIAFCHHERWDGNGYPRKLKATNIPIEGRIVAVADVFDALTHERPYKAAWPINAAVAEITKQSGTQFDPQIIEVFCQLDHEALVHPPIRPSPASIKS